MKEELKKLDKQEKWYVSIIILLPMILLVGVMVGAILNKPEISKSVLFLYFSFVIIIAYILFKRIYSQKRNLFKNFFLEKGEPVEVRKKSKMIQNRKYFAEWKLDSIFINIYQEDKWVDKERYTDIAAFRKMYQIPDE